MVTAATWIQSVSRSDGGSAPRDDFYSPERQRRPGLDEPQRLIPSEDPGDKIIDKNNWQNNWQKKKISYI